MTIIADNDLQRLEVAELLKVKMEQVDHWLISSESKNHEEMPDMAIELLELKLLLRNQADQDDSV